MKDIKQKPTFAKALIWVLIIGGVIGLLASFALTYDKIQILINPYYQPSCNLNPIFSCGSVMKTKQADLFGVPNTIFGLIGFAMLTTIGVALLAKAKFERWFWLGLQAGVTTGFIFVHYLFFEGVFRIHAICPFCFAVWMIIAPIFWYTTLYNLAVGNLCPGNRFARLKMFVLRHHGDFLLTWYVIILGILLNQFWYYWKTLL